MDFQLEQLRTLVSVLDTGSFEAAARALSVTTSAVSQRIKTLEHQAGRVLVQRTKPARPTSEGVAVLRLARQLELLESETVRVLAEPSGRTNLSIVANADSLDTWLLPALAPLEGITFDLRREDQGHSTQLLRDGTVMAALTSTPDPVQGCTVTPLGIMTYRPLASPRHVRRWPDLALAPVVIFDRKDELQDAYLRSRKIDPLAPPRHYIPGSKAFLDAVTIGLGWGMVPDLQSRELIARGSLVELQGGEPAHVSLYWQQWTLESLALTAVRDALLASARRGFRA
ncbi:MAG: LysR family transcriptional regulator ArgP [Microbacteriaceae bacterium]